MTHAQRPLRAEYLSARLAWLGMWAVLGAGLAIVVLWVGPALDLEPRHDLAAAWIERATVVAALGAIVAISALRRRYRQRAHLDALAPGQPLGAALGRASRILSALCLIPAALGVAGGLLTGNLGLTVTLGLASAALLATLRPRYDDWTTLEENGSP